MGSDSLNSKINHLDERTSYVASSGLEKEAEGNNHPQPFNKHLKVET